MSDDNPDQPDQPTPAGRSDPCDTSATALVAHGIDEGDRLVRRTYYDLVEDGFDEFDGSAEFVARVAETFRAVYAELAAPATVPADVDAAIDDARLGTLEAVDASADLRTGVLPQFYRQFAGYYCAYSGTHLPE